MSSFSYFDTPLCFDPPFGEPDRDGNQGFSVRSDGLVSFRLLAPEASRVEIDRFGTLFPLHKAEDGAWEGLFDLGRGFQYFFLKVDGADVLNPYLPIGYGCCRPMHFVDVPVQGEEAWDALADIPRGQVTRHTYFSSVTGKYEVCLVWTPFSFSANKRYPVLYLQHGYGENEVGWVYQGHVGRIADRLLADGRMKEMIIVMGNGMTRPADRAGVFALFPRVLLKDLIPFIESRYPVLDDKWHRAMAGLSMGSFQTSLTTLSHPELFGYAGVFSGFLRSPRREGDDSHLALLDDPAAFRDSFRVFYRAMGTDDMFFDRFLEDDEMLAQKQVRMIRRTFPGGHDWSVWRRCIHDFLPMLF